MGNNPPHFNYGQWRDDIPQKPGHSKELICAFNKDNPDYLTPSEYQGFKTILQAYETTVKRIPNHKQLGTRNPNKEGNPYEWKTFQEIYDIQHNLAKGLKYLELCPAQEIEDRQFRFLGILSKNREEWAITDLACMSSAVTIVPFYDSLGAEAISYIINQTELRTICIEGKQIDLLLSIKKKNPSLSLKSIICFDKIPEAKVQQAKDLDIKMYDLDDVIEAGKGANYRVLDQPIPETIYMFCYTSGTTGDPKGVMLSHANFISCGCILDWFEVGINQDDVAISYLPYGHTFEQCIFVFSLVRGFSHGYYSGDPLKLIDDIQVLKPTLFCTVPRILNRVYGKIHESIQRKGGFSQWLFNRAVNSKKYYYEHQGSLKYMMYDVTVFNKVKKTFGGNIKYMLSASAPISPEVLTFYKIALGIHVYEVYGQTETNGPCTVTHPRDPTAGHVGGVMPSMRIRLRDLLELGYLSSDEHPRGEVQFYGNNVFKGYFKNPEKTKEAFSEDGWLNSGDVGEVLPNGSLRIIDRAKNIFKLSQGEYIAPEKLENIYSQCPIVQQIFVYGDSLEPYLVAIIVPEMGQAKKYAQEKGISEDDINQVMEDKEFKDRIFQEMNDKAKEYSLNSLEKIRKIHLSPEQFTVQNDLITPTFKIKRNIAKKTFQAQIDKMYAEPL